MQKTKRFPRRNVVTQLHSNAKIEDRLTHASLLLGYLFDYGIDFQRRIIKITGEIDEEMFSIVDAALTQMEAESRATITIKIDSPGGEVYQAMAIIGRMHESTCNIVTKGYGAVMSAATLILAAGNKRKISKHAWFMNHEASYGIDGKHSEHKVIVAQAEREEQQWAECLAQFSKRPKAFWLKNGTGTDAYFSAEELITMGVVDELF